MSPLGKYSQSVAAVVAILLIVSAIAHRFVAGVGDEWLDGLAQVAIGAVFGASAATAVNGGAIKAAHRRLDLVGAPPGAVVYQDHPEQQPTIVVAPPPSAAHPANPESAGEGPSL